MERILLKLYEPDPMKLLHEELDTAYDWNAVLCFGLGIINEHYVSMLLLQEVAGEGVFEQIGVVADFSLRGFEMLSTERSVTIV